MLPLWKVTIQIERRANTPTLKHADTTDSMGDQNVSSKSYNDTYCSQNNYSSQKCKGHDKKSFKLLDSGNQNDVTDRTSFDP